MSLLTFLISSYQPGTFLLCSIITEESSVFAINIRIGGKLVRSNYEQHQSTHRNQPGRYRGPLRRGRRLPALCGQDRLCRGCADVWLPGGALWHQSGAQSPVATATAAARGTGSAGASAHLAGAIGATHGRSSYPTASTSYSRCATNAGTTCTRRARFNDSGATNASGSRATGDKIVWYNRQKGR